MTECSIAGCQKKTLARGWCGVHWRRWRRSGDPMAAPRRRENGTGSINPLGYLVFSRGRGRLKLAHVEVAERAVGHPLPSGAIIHHIDGNKLNNSPENLVVCPDDAYHLLIHQRTRALDACGNANWAKCWICKQHDDPALIPENSRAHVECKRKYDAARHAAKRFS